MSPRKVTGRNIHMTSTDKWKTFSDASKETAFKVHAIKWWEQVGSSTFRRDFVIACVESVHLDNQRGTFKLIGWSREGYVLFNFNNCSVFRLNHYIFLVGSN